MRGGPAYIGTRGKSTRRWSAIAVPTATHHGRNSTTHATSEGPGRHGAPTGGIGLIGTDGGVSSFCAPALGKLAYDLMRVFAEVSDGRA